MVAVRDDVRAVGTATVVDAMLVCSSCARVTETQSDTWSTARATSLTRNETNDALCVHDHEHSGPRLPCVHTMACYRPIDKVLPRMTTHHTGNVTDAFDGERAVRITVRGEGGGYAS